MLPIPTVIPCSVQGQRWASHLDKIQNNAVPKKQIGCIGFGKASKIADEAMELRFMLVCLITHCQWQLNEFLIIQRPLN